MRWPFGDSATLDLRTLHLGILQKCLGLPAGGGLDANNLQQPGHLRAK